MENSCLIFMHLSIKTFVEVLSSQHFFSFFFTIFSSFMQSYIYYPCIHHHPFTIIHSPSSIHHHPFTIIQPFFGTTINHPLISIIHPSSHHPINKLIHSTNNPKLILTHTHVYNQYLTLVLSYL